MSKICKDCKVITGDDHCHLCGGHNLIDEKDRYQTMEADIIGITYNKNNRMFMVKFINDGNTYEYPVVSLSELKFTDIPSIINIGKKMRKSSNLVQHQMSDEIFDNYKVHTTLHIDTLFDIIVKIESRKLPPLDYADIMDKLRKKFDVYYNDDYNYFEVGKRPHVIVVENINKRGGRGIYVYPKIYMDDKWMLLYGHKKVGMIIKKTSPNISQEIIDTVSDMLENVDSIYDDIVKKAKSTSISKYRMQNEIDIMKVGGRVSGYMLSNLSDRITDGMTYYDFALLFIDMMDYTNGVAVKDYVARRAGNAMICKI